MLQSVVYIYRFVNAQYYKILVFSSQHQQDASTSFLMRDTFGYEQSARARDSLNERFSIFHRLPSAPPRSITSMNSNLITLPVLPSIHHFAVSNSHLCGANAHTLRYNRPFARDSRAYRKRCRKRTYTQKL